MNKIIGLDTCSVGNNDRKSDWPCREKLKRDIDEGDMDLWSSGTLMDRGIDLFT